LCKCQFPDFGPDQNMLEYNTGAIYTHLYIHR